MKRRIDYVFIVGLGVCAGALLPGSIGPCGPTNNWGAIKLLLVPTGFIATAVGLVLSVAVRVKARIRKRDVEAVPSNSSRTG